MSFAQMFLLYFVTLAVFGAVDLLWVWGISRRLYPQRISRGYSGSSQRYSRGGLLPALYHRADGLRHRAGFQ